MLLYITECIVTYECYGTTQFHHNTWPLYSMQQLRNYLTLKMVNFGFVMGSNVGERFSAANISEAAAYCTFVKYWKETD